MVTPTYYVQLFRELNRVLKQESNEKYDLYSSPLEEIIKWTKGILWAKIRPLVHLMEDNSPQLLLRKEWFTWIKTKSRFELTQLGKNHLVKERKRSFHEECSRIHKVEFVNTPSFTSNTSSPSVAPVSTVLFSPSREVVDLTNSDPVLKSTTSTPYVVAPALTTPLFLQKFSGLTNRPHIKSDYTLLVTHLLEKVDFLTQELQSIKEERKRPADSLSQSTEKKQKQNE